MSAVAIPVDEATEKRLADRQKWRSMLDVLPFVEVEIKAAQLARTAAHDELAAAQAKHDTDVANANSAELAAEYSLRCIDDAKAKLLNSAPEAIAKRIISLTKQLQEIRFDKGADMLKQLSFNVDRAEEDYFNTKNGNELNAIDRAKHKLAKLEYEIADLTAQLNKAVGEALFVD